MKILFNCLVIILKSVSFTKHIEQKNESFNIRRKHISIYLDTNFDAHHIYCNSSGSSIIFSLALILVLKTTREQDRFHQLNIL